MKKKKPKFRRQRATKFPGPNRALTPPTKEHEIRGAVRAHTQINELLCWSNYQQRRATRSTEKQFPVRRKEGKLSSIQNMKFLDWYLKLAVGFATIGAAMEYFMIRTGFYDKVTVLEAEKRAAELDPRSQAIKDALNPWRTHDSKREDDP